MLYRFNPSGSLAPGRRATTRAPSHDLIREVRMKAVAIAAAVALLSVTSAWAQTGTKPVNIVAAENFYGDIAKQIGGSNVKVTSIVSNPDPESPLFEVSPSLGPEGLRPPILLC